MKVRTAYVIVPVTFPDEGDPYVDLTDGGEPGPWGDVWFEYDHGEDGEWGFDPAAYDIAYDVVTGATVDGSVPKGV